MTTAQPSELYLGKNAVDGSGNIIGSVGWVQVDEETGLPEWITVDTHMFATKVRVVPLRGSFVTADAVVLPFGKDVVKGSPEVEDAAHPDADEQNALDRYYQQHLGVASDAQVGAAEPPAGTP